MESEKTGSIFFLSELFYKYLYSSIKFLEHEKFISVFTDFIFIV